MNKTTLLAALFVTVANLFVAGCAAAPPHTEAPNVGADRHTTTTAHSIDR